MNGQDINWRRARRHHFNVGGRPVEVAYVRGACLVAYEAAVGPICMALNRTFSGESLQDAKRQAIAYVQAAPSDTMDDWRMPIDNFRRAFGLAD